LRGDVHTGFLAEHLSNFDGALAAREHEDALALAAAALLAGGNANESASANGSQRPGLWATLGPLRLRGRE
jgi:hypothetical protein